MFESLSDSLNKFFRKLSGRGSLSEANIQEGLREVRTALLQADVNYKVCKDFIEKVSAAAVGQEVIKGINPAHQIVKIVHDELVGLMGPVDVEIPYNPSGPTVILMAGLQGSGKTTTCGKLARYLMTRKGKLPLLVAADVQRPAAIEQLKVLGRQLDIPVHAEEGGRPPAICARGVQSAVEKGRDVVILDTAGRLHIDQALMAEVKDVADKTKPHQVFLVCDSMTGQDAVNSAKAFNETLALDGVILTKLDGDARGGAALSVRAVTGKPIKFIGVGEKIEAFEEFHPDRMASRILGMGDVVSLVEKAQEAIDQDKAAELERKLRRNEFTLQDFLDQFQQVRKMGPLKDLIALIPGMGGMSEMVDEKDLKHIEAIIQSMTPNERSRPELLNGSRRRRIATGSGRTIQEVNTMLKQFKEVKKMMKNMGKFKRLLGGGGRLGGRGLMGKN